MNDIYKILSSFNKVAQEPAKAEPQTKAKTQLQESMEQVLTKKLSETKASYSAKKARAGQDIGKPGKQFTKIAKGAAERYGSKERGEKVAGAVLKKLRAKEGVAEAGMGRDMTKDLTRAVEKSTGGKETLKRDTKGVLQIAKPASKKKKMSETAPPGFPKDLYKKLKKQYKDKPEAAYATMWKIHKQMKEAYEQAVAQGLIEAAKPDYVDLDKDSNKSEPMKKAAKDAKAKKVSEEVRVHKGKYGTEYQGDPDDEDSEGKKIKKDKPASTEKRGRGRPKKGADNLGVVKKYSGDALSQALGGGEKPKSKAKPSRVHTMKESVDALLKNVRLNETRMPPEYMADVGKLVKVIRSVKTQAQLAAAQRMADILLQKYTAKSTNMADWGEKRSRVRGDAESELEPKRRELGANESIDAGAEAKSVSYDQDQLKKALGDADYETLQSQLATTGDVSDDIMDKLMQHFMDSGEMPYGTAKARDGDPYQWIADRLEQIFPDQGDQSPADGYNDATDRATNEGDMEEGNAFSGAVAKAKADGIQPGEKITVGGKEYPVKEDEELNQMRRIAGLPVNECGMSPVPMQQTQQSSEMNISTNMNSNGEKSVNVTATGDSADALMQMLKLSGMRSDAVTVSADSEEAVEEEKDPRYEANTTPEETVLPTQAQTKGGDGDVAGEEKDMDPDGSARFSDNPMAVKKVKEEVDSLENMGLNLLRDYNSIKKVQK